MLPSVYHVAFIMSRCAAIGSSTHLKVPSLRKGMDGIREARRPRNLSKSSLSGPMRCMAKLAALGGGGKPFCGLLAAHSNL